MHENYEVESILESNILLLLLHPWETTNTHDFLAHLFQKESNRGKREKRRIVIIWICIRCVWSSTEAKKYWYTKEMCKTFMNNVRIFFHHMLLFVVLVVLHLLVIVWELLLLYFVKMSQNRQNEKYNKFYFIS